MERPKPKEDTGTHTLSRGQQAFVQQGQPLRHLFIITVFTAIVALAGTFSLPPLDRDESRYMQATTQMLESGDFVTISFQDDERNKKPAGIYWLQAASVAAFSTPKARAPWAYRMPSFLAAILAALSVYAVGCLLFDARVALFASLLLASAPAFTGEATIAKTDAALTACIAGAQACLAYLWMQARDARRGSFFIAILFWAALGMGILIKGPIAPMVSFFTIAGLFFASTIAGIRAPAHDLSWRTAKTLLSSLRPLWGGALLCLMVLPWAIAIGIATEGRFFTEAIGKDMLGKVSEQQERHGGPFGYHFLALWFMFWPAGLFLPLATRYVIGRLAHPGVLFCLAWAVPSWFVFEAISTKLPHYTLPLYAALALLCAYAVLEIGKHYQAVLPMRGMRFLGSFIYLITGILLALLLLYGPWTYSVQGLQAENYVYAALITSGTLGSLILFWRTSLARAMLCAIVTSGVMAWCLFEGTLPRLEAFNLSRQISHTLAAHGHHPLHQKQEPVALLGYNEPSAVFLLGTTTRLAHPQGAALYLAQKPGRVAIVDKRKRDAFLSYADTTQLEVFADLHGLNYSNGRDIELTFYRSQITQE